MLVIIQREVPIKRDLLVPLAKSRHADLDITVQKVLQIRYPVHQVNTINQQRALESAHGARTDDIALVQLIYLVKMIVQGEIILMAPNEFVQKDLIVKQQLLAMTRAIARKKKSVKKSAPHQDINFAQREVIIVFWLLPIQTVPHVTKAELRNSDSQITRNCGH